jgi:acyl-CoA synthetase (AMP-forming)/AMP-acid ligase II
MRNINRREFVTLSAAGLSGLTLAACGNSNQSAPAETTEADIEQFCLALPRYKRPRKIIFATVPRNPTGKIEKPKLREIYGAKQLVAEQVGR